VRNPDSGSTRLLTGSGGPAPSSHQIWRVIGSRRSEAPQVTRADGALGGAGGFACSRGASRLGSTDRPIAQSLPQFVGGSLCRLPVDGTVADVAVAVVGLLVERNIDVVGEHLD
jgi:hypothetical protein